MKGLSLRLFLRDRLLFVFLVLLVIALCVMLLLLERERYQGYIGLETVYYFVALSFFLLVVWLIIDYIRQRQYYRQVWTAIQRADELQATAIVKAAATSEQKLVIRLLEEQHRAYLNELGRYRRQQELHNHFVLRWVHHMKTPVSVIDLLAQDAGSKASLQMEEMRELLASVQEETGRMEQGLEMMLYSARMDKFELDLHVKRLPLHELARKVINANKKLCIRHSIFPRVEGEAWVETDEKWITFVLQQLVSNAIKYSKNKPEAGKLLVQLKQEESGGRLEISDDGMGIAPHDLPRVFDPFFTGENGRTAGESTGMGLYLAMQVCSRLGHRLSVSSVLGEGTTFTVDYRTSGIHLMDNRKDI